MARESGAGRRRRRGRASRHPLRERVRCSCGSRRCDRLAFARCRGGQRQRAPRAGHGALVRKWLANVTPFVGAGFLRRAAESGSAEACLRLGVLYSQGDGVVQDYREAAAWYARAADMGQPGWALQSCFSAFAGLGLRQGHSERLATPRASWSVGKPRGSHGAIRPFIWMAAISRQTKPLPDDGCTWPPTREAAKRLACSSSKWMRGAPMRQPRLGSSPCSRAQPSAATSTLRSSLANFAPKVGMSRKIAKRRLLGSRAPPSGQRYRPGLAGRYAVAGRRVVADQEAALGWYRRAASAGHQGALLVLTKHAFAVVGHRGGMGSPVHSLARQRRSRRARSPSGWWAISICGESGPGSRALRRSVGYAMAAAQGNSAARVLLAG